MKNSTKKCRKKECRELAENYRLLQDALADRKREVYVLQDKLAAKQVDSLRSSEALIARTELVKALSWAMKTCSSIAWSDRTVYGSKP